MNEIEMGNKKTALIICSGAPAAGKSTWGKKFAQDNDLVYVSTDEIRKELSGSESDQSVSTAAFGLAKQRISSALSSGKSAMIDATSVNRKSRRDWINIGKGRGSYIVVVAFEVSKDELIRRDAKRDRKVGQEIIERFFNKYERPDTAEGIDKVIIK